MGLNEASGFAIGKSGGARRFDFFDNAVAFAIIDGTGQHAVAPPGFGARGIHLEFTLTGPDTYSLAYNALGQPPRVFQGVLDGPAGTPMSVFVWTLVLPLVFRRQR
jgi:hypothetical protein